VRLFLWCRNRSAFEELFSYASPKFITTGSPPYHDPEALASFDEKAVPDPVQHQLKVFMADVSGQLLNADVRSFIKLYKSLGTEKLAAFLGADEEDVIEMMMVTKASTRRLKWTEGGLLEGEVINVSDLDFNIDGVSGVHSNAARLRPFADHCIDVLRT